MMIEQYQFGYPETKRKMAIEEALSSSKENHYENYQGKYRPLPVIEIRIEALVYRMENIRTKNIQKEWLARHPECAKDLFTRDPFSIEAQETQHELLKKVVDKENLLSAFKKDGKKEGMQQKDPIICSDNGIVVNGNRRLCAWRELYYSDKEKYKHFEMIRVAVLPNHDKVGMADLEYELQIQSPMKAEYDWHSTAADAKERSESGTGIDIIAKKSGKSPNEIGTLIECYDYASEYLESIGHPDEWSLVDKQFYAFREIVKGRKNLKNPGDKELFQEISKSILQTPAKGDRLYNQIPKIVANLGDISPKLTEVFGIDIEAETEVEDDLDILGGGDQSDIDMKNARIAEKIRTAEDPAKVVDTVRIVIESKDEMEKEKKKKGFIFEQVVKSATALNNAVSNLSDDMNKEGVARQIENIEAALVVLKDWIK